jgi:tRNA A37 threonylcarbamoyladenosine modification protein TsaB
MEVYTAAFDADLQAIAPTQAWPVGSAADLAQKLGAHALPVVLLGDGVDKLLPLLAEPLVRNTVQVLALPQLGCTAASIGRMGWQQLQTGQLTPLADFAPFYLKPVNISPPKEVRA